MLITLMGRFSRAKYVDHTIQTENQSNSHDKSIKQSVAHSVKKSLLYCTYLSKVSTMSRRINLNTLELRSTNIFLMYS